MMTLRTLMLAGTVAAAFGAIGPGLAQDAAPAAPEAAAEPAAPALSPAAEKGRYLATAGNCASCHTAEGGKPFAGGVAFPTDFGTIYSTNITQDAETGIGKWTADDFKKAMRQGVRPDGTHLYPAFPYTAFTALSDEDVAALYAFIKTLAPVSAPAKANTLKFPYDQRALMAVWKALFFKDARFVPVAGRAADVNRGAYLVEGLGHCSACHTPRNFLGAEKMDAFLTGGVYNDAVLPGQVRPWAAVNLTPAPTGLGAWSAEDIAAYLKTGLSKRATTFGPMNEVVMNSTRHLSDDDIKAIAAYLKALPAKDQGTGPAASKEVLAMGETVYTVRCGTCHLPTGLGSDTLGVSLVGSAVVQAPSPASLINNVLYGAKLPPAPFNSGRRTMTAFADELRDEEVAAVASYVRSAWGNKAGAVSPAEVARQR
jgi:mono/diheme cytochrome c family protein